MKLHPFIELDWIKAVAKQPGRCSLSGQQIKDGDLIYAANNGYLVLVSEYNRYANGEH